MQRKFHSVFWEVKELEKEEEDSGTQSKKKTMLSLLQVRTHRAVAVLPPKRMRLSSFLESGSYSEVFPLLSARLNSNVHR